MDPGRFQFSLRLALCSMGCFAIAFASAGRLLAWMKSTPHQRDDITVAFILFYWPVFSMAMSAGIGLIFGKLGYGFVMGAIIACVPCLLVLILL